MSVSYSQHPMPHQGSPSTYSTCPNFPIPLWEWSAAKSQFAITFGERFIQAAA
jgi:hypothetical protein